MTLLWRLLAVFLVLGLGAALVVVLLHRSFIYPFAPDIFVVAGYAPEPVAVPGQVDLPVQVHRAADPAASVMIYFMGNVGSLQVHERSLKQMRDAGFNVVAMPYRGGGGVPGTPSETRLIADALAVFDWTRGWAQGPLILRGYSLGTGVAMAVAAEREAGAVILTAPFTRICSLITDRVILPACLIPGIDTWNSLARVAMVTEPVLILHGTADLLVPFVMGEALAQALRVGGVRVTLAPIVGGNHSTLDLDPDFDAAVAAFIAELPAR